MPVNKTNRCLYRSNFRPFIEADPYLILGCIHDAFHGKTFTTADEAWLGEINLLQKVLLPWKDEEAEIIFEYDIPRLGKRIDVVLLLRGNHSVEDITRHEADKVNTDATIAYILEVINRSKKKWRKEHLLCY